MEVALGIQFEAPGWSGMSISEFWSRVRAEYPTREEHPPLGPLVEEFGAAAPPRVELKLLAQAPMPRYWFIDATGHFLIQVQQDRLVLNWRKVDDTDEYPRYGELRDRLAHVLAEFEAVEDVEAFRPNWCEVAYINHVPVDDHGTLHDILVSVSAPPPSPLRPVLEDVQFLQRFPLARQDLGLGRLNVQAMPAFRSETNEPIYLLTLTVRGNLTTPTSESALEFLDYGRELIVRSFADLTTPEMHRRWKVEGV